MSADRPVPLRRARGEDAERVVYFAPYRLLYGRGELILGHTEAGVAATRPVFTSPYPEEVACVVRLPVRSYAYYSLALGDGFAVRTTAIRDALGATPGRTTESVLSVALVAVLARYGYSLGEVEAAVSLADGTVARWRVLSGFTGATRLHRLAAAIKTRMGLSDPNRHAYEESLAYAFGSWADDL